MNIKNSSNITKLIILNNSIVKPNLNEIRKNLCLENSYIDNLPDEKINIVNDEQYLCYNKLYRLMKKKL